jgi:hypothetical protein
MQIGSHFRLALRYIHASVSGYKGLAHTKTAIIAGTSHQSVSVRPHAKPWQTYPRNPWPMLAIFKVYIQLQVSGWYPATTVPQRLVVLGARNNTETWSKSWIAVTL